MALDSTGLTIQRFSEVFEDLNTGIKARLGSNVDTSEFSLMGNFHANIAIKLAELNELAQAVYDAGNLYQAEGSALDNLALQVGVLRNVATRSNGILYWEGRDGATVAEGVKVSSIKGDIFYVPNTFLISSTSCLKLRCYVNTVANSTTYTVTLDGVDYNYESDVSATIAEILAGLEDEISASGLVTVSVVTDINTPANSYLLIDKIDKDTEMAVSGISYLTFDNVVTPSRIYAEQYGLVIGDALTVTTINTGVTGLYTITNPYDFTLGTETEIDEDLRKRILREFDTVGSGTLDSIITTLLRVDGVEDAIVKENNDDEPLVDGSSTIPAKSYECIVNGGLDEDVAKAIWSTKPAGIYTHGSEAISVEDFNGYPHTVRFTRPEVRYFFVYIEYSTYGEETFPTGALDAAKAAILKYTSENISLGDDVIAKRFLGPLYSAATGFGDVIIKVAHTNNPATTPSYPADYYDVRAMTDRQIASFATNRIIFDAM